MKDNWPLGRYEKKEKHNGYDSETKQKLWKIY